MDTVKFRKVFSNLPTFETQRLILKKIEKENTADMFAYASLNTVTRYLLWSEHLNIDDTAGYIEFLQRKYKKGEYCDWGIVCKADNVFIGTIGYANVYFNDNKVEIGYVLNPAYQGRGYMTEALSRIMDFSFSELGINRIEARVMEGNTSSEKLLLSLGFKLEGKCIDSIFIKNKYRTLHHYAALRLK